MRLIPTDQQFYDALADLASRIPVAAGLVRDLFADPARTRELAVAVRRVEHDADRVTHDIINRIDATFFTPLDSEDIHELATRLDTVIDMLDDAAQRAQMYHITVVREPAVRLAGVVADASAVLASAVTALRHAKAVLPLTRDVKRFEEEADAIYQEAVGRLFDGAPVPLEVLKWKDIYDALEEAADACSHAAQVLESVAIKQG